MVRAISTRKAFVVLTGRYRSGQTGQTVNLLALRLRWFESSPAQTFVKTLIRCSRLVATRRLQRNHPELGDTRHDGQALPGLQKIADSRVRIPSSRLFAGHLRGVRHILHRRSLGHHRRVVAVPAGELHSRSAPGLQRFDH
jgi:hypothetical protein